MGPTRKIRAGHLWPHLRGGVLCACCKPNSFALCACSPSGLLKPDGAGVREGTLLHSQASLVAF